MEDSAGNIWFTAGDDLNLFEPKAEGGARFTYFTTKEGLSSIKIRSMIEDSQGNIWLGTEGGGVNRLNPNSFQHFTTNEGLSHYQVWSISEDSNGHLWFGTYHVGRPSNGVNRYDGQNFTHFTTLEGLSRPSILSIIEDNQGMLWLGTGNGLNRYDPVKKEIAYYTEKEGLIKNNVESMFVDTQGNIWMGYLGFNKPGGFSLFDGQSFTHFTVEEGFLADGVSSILADSQGYIWLASGAWGNLGQGVGRYDPSLEEIIYYSKNEGLASDEVRSILEDSNGHMWFGTDGGGISYAQTSESPSFINFTVQDGLIDNHIWSIQEDHQKNIWISTEKGIGLFVPIKEEKTLATESLIPGYQFYSFGNADGLSQIKFQPTSAYFDSQNRMWWGSSRNLTMLDLKKFELPTEAPRNVQLSHIDIQQKYVDFQRLADTSYRSITI